MSNQITDVLIIGGGIIGVSLALELNRRGISVRVYERGEPGREASHAGAGMLAAQDGEIPLCLRELAAASESMYPEWVANLEEESGLRADLRKEGTLYVGEHIKPLTGDHLTQQRVAEIEPLLKIDSGALWTSEASVDPRALMAATLAVAHKRGIAVTHEHAVAGVEVTDSRVTGVRLGDRREPAGVVVNCAGAWAQKITGANVPAHPVKGQMLSVVDPHQKGPLLRHVVRGDEIYLVPRSDGRILIGATVEKVGFDKRVNPEVILNMQHAAAKLVPQIAEMRIHESWAGLRPGSPDKMPLLGETNIKGYFAATGHYRNGILLAPVTAQLMAKIICGEPSGFDLKAFDPKRFT